MSLGKHFINGVEDIIVRGLRASLYGNPSLRLLESEKVLYRQPKQNEDKVLLLAGGGSGHEPAYAGYLGDGMLDIAVAGQIFASPSATQVEAGLKAVNSSKGTLLVVKNYTGDKLNFGLAAEKAKASGVKAEVVFVDEDVSVEGNSLVGRRGLAGIVFVLKIAGALAAKGATLEQVASIARHTVSRMGTAAVSLDKCSVPNRGPQDSLPYSELEYGMGIHNEPGVAREAFKSLQESVKRLVDMLKCSPTSQHGMALMVNNLGGLSVLEINVIAEESIRQLKQRGLQIVRVLIGTFLTSLDGRGFSLTLLELDNDLLPLFDAPCSASAWPRNISDVGEDAEKQIVESTITVNEENAHQTGQLNVSTILLQKIVKAVIKATQHDEPMITEYDTLAGDGDCGETLLNGVHRLAEETCTIKGEEVAVCEVIRRAAVAAERGMGGTSGALYAIFLNALASALRQRGQESSWTAIAAALQDALSELCRYTLARKGQRTLMDALIPFVENFQEGDLDKAYQAAKAGAESTRMMAAAMGRASYVGKEVFDREGGIPDPGALGVVSVIRGICEGLQQDKEA